MNNYIIGAKDGKLIVVTEKEVIDNALKQESEGVKPMFCRRGRDHVTPLGWLVWSSWDYGCGVVYRRHDGKMIISTGFQGDFSVC